MSPARPTATAGDCAWPTGPVATAGDVRASSASPRGGAPGRNDEIGDLNDITLIQRGIFEDDTEAEDELSSLIFIGPQGRSVQCFNAGDFSDDEGQLDITIGPSLFAIVRNLHSATPASEPQGNEAVVVAPPDGTRFGSITDPVHSIETFGDGFSSLRFA